MISASDTDHTRNKQGKPFKKGPSEEITKELLQQNRNRLKINKGLLSGHYPAKNLISCIVSWRLSRNGQLPKERTKPLR